MQLDPHVNQYGKVSALSANTSHFPNWGKITAKLVVKRPEERYYPLSFHGTVV